MVATSVTAMKAVNSVVETTQTATQLLFSTLSRLRARCLGLGGGSHAISLPDLTPSFSVLMHLNLNFMQHKTGSIANYQS